MFYCNILICLVFGCCLSENMINYKLLSNSPITKYCPDDLRNIYRIYEKHPEMSNIAICCGTRISHNFILTEQHCLERFNPKYITAHSCKNVSNKFPAQEIYRKDKTLLNGVAIIKIFAGIRDNSTIQSYYKFFIDHYIFGKDDRNCTIYGTTAQSKKDPHTYYMKWITVLNNTVTVSKNCQSFDSDKWICPKSNFVQFCEEDIGCPMICNDQLIGIASQRYNRKTWGRKMNCGNLDVNTRYLYLNREIVKWIKNVLKK